MTGESVRLDSDVGVVLIDGHSEPICYSLVAEIELRTEPYHAGGTVTHKIPTGRFSIGAARYLGCPPLKIDAAIDTAVRADCAKRGIEVV